MAAGIVQGVDLGLKGERALAGKTALQSRGALRPGQRGHGRRPRQSVYGAQLREAQKLKVICGVREQRFRRYLQEARRRQDATTGEVLLELLERRLDNMVYRLGLPARLESDADSLAGRVLRSPTRAEIDEPVAEQLVIERYSHR